MIYDMLGWLSGLGKRVGRDGGVWMKRISFLHMVGSATGEWE